MTRDQKIEAIAEQMMKHAELISDAIIFGRIGLNDMTDDEIDEQFELWCEDDDDETV